MSEIPKRRISYLIAVGFLVTVSLFLALVVQVGLTAAATGSSGASASRTLQGKVHIEVKGEDLGGRFTISGAIRDRGRFADSYVGFTRSRKLIGAKGTIWIEIGFAPRPRCSCNWRITKGTGAYDGLRGRGREQGMYEGHYEGGYSPTTHLTMYGAVSQ